MHQEDKQTDPRSLNLSALFSTASSWICTSPETSDFIAEIRRRFDVGPDAEWPSENLAQTIYAAAQGFVAGSIPSDLLPGPLQCFAGILPAVVNNIAWVLANYTITGKVPPLPIEVAFDSLVPLIAEATPTTGKGGRPPRGDIRGFVQSRLDWPNGEIAAELDEAYPREYPSVAYDLRIRRWSKRVTYYRREVKTTLPARG